MKFIWKLIYKFNAKFLFWIPGIIIANSKQYETSDEFVKLRADGWVIVCSKEDSKYSDMLPLTFVSQYAVDMLEKSIK